MERLKGKGEKGSGGGGGVQQGGVRRFSPAIANQQRGAAGCHSNLERSDEEVCRFAKKQHEFSRQTHTGYKIARCVGRSATKQRVFSRQTHTGYKIAPLFRVGSLAFSWLDRKFSCRCMTFFLLCPTSTRLSHLLRLPEFLASTPRRVDSGHRNPVARFVPFRSVL